MTASTPPQSPPASTAPVIRRILVPIDVFDVCREAVDFAVDLAQRYGGAELTLLHVYQPQTYALPPDSMMFAGPQVMATQVTQADEALTALRKEIEGRGVPRVATHIAQGDPVDEILREVRDRGHDLCVMGTHGRTGLAHALLGSVAEKVVRRAPCAVLTVHSPHNAR